MKDTIEAVEEGFTQFYLGKAIMPSRPVIRVEKHDGVVLVMPAYIAPMNALATKVVTVYPRNPKEHNLPSTMGTVMVNDPQTGKLLSLLDGGHITAMRTGAVTGIATKYLSRQDSKVVGVIGLGVQARVQLMAVCEVRNIEKVKAYDVLPEVRRTYAEEMSKKLGVDVTAVDCNKDAVSGADIVTTCSTASEPVFDGNWISGGTHINGIGSHRPEIRELDTTVIKRSKVVVDSRAACLTEAGDLIIPISEGAITEDHIYAELSEIILGKKPRRTSDSEITLFKSVGLAIQDASTAIKAYELAMKMNVGTMIEI
jgi:ornithine cyclodeaminase/alanine dehydrogenase